MPRRPGRRLRGLPLPPRGKPATVGRDRRRRPLIQVRCNEPQVVPGRLCGAWPYRALVAPTRPHRVLLIAPRPRPRLAELARFRSRLVLLTAARSGPARFRWSPVGPVWLTRSRVASGWFRWCPVGPAWLTRSRVASAWFRWSPVGPAWPTWSRVASARFRRAGFPAAGRQRTWPGPPRLPAADRTPARTTPAGLGAALITARPGIRPVRLEHRAVVRPVRARLVWARLVWARLVWDRPLRARLVWDRPLRARLVRDRPLRARLVRARPLRARLVRARPLRARLVPDRPLRARLVRARLVKPGIGVGGATVAARLAPVRPEGSTGRTRRRRPGIPALGPTVVGAPGRPTIRPGHAIVRRARIHIVPSRLLGHLDSDVSRCRSITRAARDLRDVDAAPARPETRGWSPPERVGPRRRADHGVSTELRFFRNRLGCQRFFPLCGAGCERHRLLARGCRGSFHRQIERFADGAGEPLGLDRQRAAGEHPKGATRGQRPGLTA